MVNFSKRSKSAYWTIEASGCGRLLVMLLMPNLRDILLVLHNTVVLIVTIVSTLDPTDTGQVV